MPRKGVRWLLWRFIGICWFLIVRRRCITWHHNCRLPITTRYLPIVTTKAPGVASLSSPNNERNSQTVCGILTLRCQTMGNEDESRLPGLAWKRWGDDESTAKRREDYSAARNLGSESQHAQWPRKALGRKTVGLNSVSVSFTIALS